LSLEGQGLWFVAVHNDFLLCHGTGMFFFRNSEWSRHFLDLWWNQTAFVQPFGQSKSGDNDALKHLLDIMPENERNQHIRIPQMQCLFNSNVWKFSWRSGLRLVTVTKTIWQG
jgi:mannan polymerase II complex MNN10 subunit